MGKNTYITKKKQYILIDKNSFEVFKVLIEASLRLLGKNNIGGLGIFAIISSIVYNVYRNIVCLSNKQN